MTLQVFNFCLHSANQCCCLCCPSSFLHPHPLWFWGVGKKFYENFTIYSKSGDVKTSGNFFVCEPPERQKCSEETLQWSNIQSSAIKRLQGCSWPQAGVAAVVVSGLETELAEISY